MDTEKKLGLEGLGKVWGKVFTLIQSVTGDVDVAGKGTLQNQIDTHTQNKENPHGVTASDVGLGNVPNVATNDQTPTFTQASTRSNIVSGEKHSVIMGKIMKWFADLTAPAFTQMITSYSDLLANTVAGYLLDALVVKEIFNEINSNLNAVVIGSNNVEYADGITMWHHDQIALHQNVLRISFGFKTESEVAKYTTIATIPENVRGNFSSAVIIISQSGTGIYSGYYDAAKGIIRTYDNSVPAGNYFVISA